MISPDNISMLFPLARKGESWVPVHEGTRGIPIGRSLYRVRHISDDGYLIELEKEK